MLNDTKDNAILKIELRALLTNKNVTYEFRYVQLIRNFVLSFQDIWATKLFLSIFEVKYRVITVKGQATFWGPCFLHKLLLKNKLL